VYYSDYPQPPPIAPDPQPGWRRRRRWVIGVVVLILAIVAGVLAWPSSTASQASATQTAPFYEAVSNLSAQPVIDYSGSVPGDGVSWDVHVTNGGEETGTVSADGEQISILAVAGKTYFKLPQDLLSTLPSGVSGSEVSGKWVTGDDELTSMLPTGLGSPIDLAAQLWTDLDGVTEFPAVGAATNRIDGVAALGVHTAAGELYVSAKAPYRVLRLAPATASTESGTATTTAASFSAVADARGYARDVSADNAGSLGQTDFEPMSAAADAQDLNQVVADTRQLSSAIDIGVSFDFNQTGNLDCSDSECTVTENVTTSTAATQSSVKNLSGTVTAVMTASVTVNGQSGGSCTQTSTMPINGSGVMTCVDAGVAPVVSELKQQAQEEADAEAAETGEDATVPLDLNFEAEVEIEAEAMVQAQIEQQVADEQDELDAAQEQNQQEQSCPADGTAASTGSALIESAGFEPAGVSARACGGKVGVNSGGLASKAYNARSNADRSRFPVGPRITSVGGNVAAATVEVNGQPRTLIGFSNGDPLHSEDDIINQINELKAQGAEVGKITELYSERQPCLRCDASLSDYLADNPDVSWSVPWTDNAQINAAANELLMYLIRMASGGY